VCHPLGLGAADPLHEVVLLLQHRVIAVEALPERLRARDELDFPLLRDWSESL
jgi:hypothetical protein